MARRNPPITQTRGVKPGDPPRPLPPHVEAEARVILRREARRLLAERLRREKERRH